MRDSWRISPTCSFFLYQPVNTYVQVMYDFSYKLCGYTSKTTLVNFIDLSRQEENTLRFIFIKPANFSCITIQKVHWVLELTGKKLIRVVLRRIFISLARLIAKRKLERYQSTRIFPYFYIVIIRRRLRCECYSYLLD